MREIIISKTEEGIRLNKYLTKLFNDMPYSLLYKLLRKKYFEINEKKASGNEILHTGDKLSIFLGEETYNKYKGSVKNVDYNTVPFDESKVKNIKDRIVYEDDNIIIYNKPVGMLSQSNDEKILSVNELLKSYIKFSKSLVDLEIKYTPSIVNRLDRNTSGLIIFAKTYVAAREISDMIKRQKLEKHYKTIVNGLLKNDEGELVHLYKKDEKSNKAIIIDLDDTIHIDGNDENDLKVEKAGYSVVKLRYKVIDRKNDKTEVDVNLITGKSHQIRAQFSHIGHPIVCDKKYMDADLYAKNLKEFKKISQILTCYKIKFDKFESDLLKDLNYKIFVI